MRVKVLGAVRRLSDEDESRVADQIEQRIVIIRASGQRLDSRADRRNGVTL